MDKKWSYNSLEPHLLNLRIGGYFQIDRSSSPMQIYLHKIYTRIILFLTILFTCQQIIRVYQVRDDLNTVTETMFLLLTHLDSIYKEVVMLLKADQVQELLEIMKGKLFNQPEKEHKKLLQATAREAKILLRLSNFIALVTCFLWAVYPLILYLQGKEAVFAVWLPFELDENWKFYMALLYVWIQTSWLAINNTTLDVLITFFLAQCTTQLKILRYDLESFVENCEIMSKHSGESITNIFAKKFQSISLHHVEINNFYKKIEDIYGGPVFCLFLFSGWTLCTTGFRLVEIDIASVEFLSMVLYLICMLGELFLFCFYGSELMDAVVKSSYTFYAFLKNTEKQKS